MSLIVSRLSEYIKHKKLSIRQFEMSVGMSNGALGKAIKNGTDIQMRYMDSIFKEFSDINPTWLVTGEGEMTLETQNLQEPSSEYFPSKDNQKDLVEILSGPSQTAREQVLKEEVIRLRQAIEELRNLNDKNILETLKDILKKQSQ